ncbi:photosystem II stability/assembly factor-like protein [Reichenbachiella sp.]|uniref:WD40/YVTN/BNR-like repeat-containing protein n=1 Tax=Reichenbachiella sp. TaxID=2184521 RepID=UPI003299AC65
MKNTIIILATILISCQPSKTTYTWEEFSLEGNPSLRGISALNEKIIWVSGTNGTVVKTENGGLNWEEVFIPDSDSLDFRDVEVLTKDEIVLMSAGSGAQSNIFKSKDGGRHWKKALVNAYDSGFYDGIAFWNETEGILGGDPVHGKLFLMRTSDGGDTWQRIHPDKLPEMNEGEFGGFAASGSHLTVKGESVWIGSGAATSRVFYSQDKGEHWEVVYTPIIQGEGSQGIFSIDFYDENTGIAVGGDYTKEDEGTKNVILTLDGATNWKLADSFPLFQSSVRYLSKDQLISTGPAASYTSDNGGKSWSKIEGTGYHTLDVSKDGTIWAAGRDGRIAQLIAE